MNVDTLFRDILSFKKHCEIYIMYVHKRKIPVKNGVHQKSVSHTGAHIFFIFLALHVNTLCDAYMFIDIIQGYPKW